MSNREFILVAVGDDHLSRAVGLRDRIREFTEIRVNIIAARIAGGPAPYDSKHVTISDQLTDHEAAIILKTGCSEYLDQSVERACYLDNDVIPISKEIESIFRSTEADIAFASDERSIDYFSPWAIKCDCGFEKECSHLREQIELDFGITISDPDWPILNGGVFSFNTNGRAHLRLWHHFAARSLRNPRWRARDQGVLAAVAWDLGPHRVGRLQKRYNWVVDCMLGVPVERRREVDPTNMGIDRSYSLTVGEPSQRPAFLHFINNGVGRVGWKNWDDVVKAVGADGAPAV